MFTSSVFQAFCPCSFHFTFEAQEQRQHSLYLELWDLHWLTFDLLHHQLVNPYL
jgi:hypothetical protein